MRWMRPRLHQLAFRGEGKNQCARRSASVRHGRRGGWCKRGSQGVESKLAIQIAAGAQGKFVHAGDGALNPLHINDASKIRELTRERWIAEGGLLDCGS